MLPQGGGSSWNVDGELMPPAGMALGIHRAGVEVFARGPEDLP